jgi:CheY-like chemotaxis protein
MIQETVFVVDDVPANLGVLFDALEISGFKILIDTDGKSAIEAIGQVIPDIILLDVMMPGMDGFETCRMLKSNPNTRDIPVIFMTALNEVIDEVKGLELGAVDYIIKPFRVEIVLARIRTHLTLRNLQKSLEKKNAELQDALDNVETLSGLLPICANCKKIRDDKGYWNQLETYISKHTPAEFTHAICPDCVKKLYGEDVWKRVSKKLKRDDPDNHREEKQVCDLK